MTPARDEVLAVFADLAEEDPTVLQDLLLRVARWERQLPAWWAAGPWRSAADSWIREDVGIGRTRGMSVRADPARAGAWSVSARPSFGTETEKLGLYGNLEAAKAAGDAWCRAQGWTLPEDSAPVGRSP